MINDFSQQFDAIKAYFNSGITHDIDWRKTQLTQLRKLLEENEDQISEVLQKDLGKNITESWIAEIGFTITEINHSLKHLKKWHSVVKVSTPLIALPAKSYLQPEPKGLVLIVGAWNYPVQLLLGPLIAAISAGNCAVLKPSELATHTSELLTSLIPLYLENKAFCVVQGGADETGFLLTHAFDHIFYTGGEQVGKIVMRAASEHLTPVTLELGGKSPCVVDSNIDLDVSAARIVWSKWMNAGQTCVAPDYILVDKKQCDALVSAIKEKLSEFYGADAKGSDDYGRIINIKHVRRLRDYLVDQNVILGGHIDEQERYIAPTIVLNPPLDSSIMQAEIFGPILPIVTLDNIQEAAAFITARPKPLALYIYSRNKVLQQHLLSTTSAGNVAINDGMLFMANPKLPFGGVGHSGMGAYHGKFGFDTFSHLKSVIHRPFWLDSALRYPPFSSFKKAIFKYFL